MQERRLFEQPALILIPKQKSMRTSVLIAMAVVVLHAASVFFGVSTLGVILGTALVVGFLLAPYRAFQAITGRLSLGGSPPIKASDRLAALFVLAFLFWLGLLWALYNIEFIQSCNGDTCIGYMLLAMPFPLLYGWAELTLFSDRRATRH